MNLADFDLFIAAVSEAGCPPAQVSYYRGGRFAENRADADDAGAVWTWQRPLPAAVAEKALEVTGVAMLLGHPLMDDGTASAEWITMACPPDESLGSGFRGMLAPTQTMMEQPTKEAS